MSDNPFLEELKKMQEEPDPFTGMVEIRKDYAVSYEDDKPEKARIVDDLKSGGRDVQVPMTNKVKADNVEKPQMVPDKAHMDFHRNLQAEREDSKPKPTKYPKAKPTEDRKVFYAGEAKKKLPVKDTIKDKDVKSTIKARQDAPDKRNDTVLADRGIPHGKEPENRYKPEGKSTSIEDSPFRHRDEADADGVHLVQSYMRPQNVSHFQKQLAEARAEVKAAREKNDKYAAQKALSKVKAMEEKLTEAVNTHIDYERKSHSLNPKKEQPNWEKMRSDLMSGKGMESWDKMNEENPQLGRQVMSEIEDKRRKGLLKMADDIRDAIMENLEKAIDKSLYSDFKDDLVEIVKACMYDEDIHFAELAKSFEDEVAMVNDQEFRKSQMDFEELVKAYNESVEVINRLVDEVSVLRKAIEAEDGEDDFDFGEEEKPKKKKAEDDDEEDEEELDKAGEEAGADPNSNGAAVTEPESMSKAGGKGGFDQDFAAKVGKKVLKPGANMDVTVKDQTEAKKELEKHPNPEIGKSEGEDFEAPYPGATVEAERARPNDIAKMNDRDIGTMDWKDFVKQAGSPKFY